MIGAITMNVAIDKAYFMKCENTPGEVMRVAKCHATPGGKGLNVARAAKSMGRSVLASGMIGGHAGEWVREALERESVLCDFEPVDGETRTCINIIEPDGRQTEFLEPGMEISKADIDRFLIRFEAIVSKCSVITISGSVPRGADETLYPKMIEICKAHACPVLLDTSSALLKAGSRALPTLVKPNADEIRQLLNLPDMDLKDFAAIRSAAVKLHETGIAYVAVSLGADGCILACEEGVFRAYPPKITPVNTTGCGDSMLAGFAIGISERWSAPDTLAFATAVSAANALETGTGCVVPEKARALLENVRVERIA